MLGRSQDDLRITRSKHQGAAKRCGRRRLVIGTTVDWLLDRTIAPGFSSVGYRARGLAGTSPDPAGNLLGRDILVTGANSGIGAAASEQLATLGARVHMVVRDLEKGEDARARISERTGSDELHLHRCDLSSLESVRELAASLRADLDGVDGVVHNAGVMTKERSLSADGHELTVATHVLGPLLLTELLAPLLAARDSARVVFVTSGGMYAERLDVEDLELTRREFNGTTFYAHAKRIQVILAGQLDARLDPEGISVHSMHPGWVDTPGVVDSLPAFHRITKPVLRSPAEGADTIVWLLAADRPAREGEGGQLWMDRRPRPAHRVPWTRESAPERGRLWAKLSELAELSAIEVGAR